MKLKKTSVMGAKSTGKVIDLRSATLKAKEGSDLHKQGTSKTAAKAVSGAKKGKKGAKVKAVVARAKYAGLTGDCVLFVQGGKGTAFRKANVTGDGFAKLTQNNVGLRYDGATIDLLNLSKMDKGQKIELGNYIAGRGNVVKVDVITEANALAMASRSVEIERANGAEVTIKTLDKIATQYVASVEKMKGGNHFFQLETKRIKGKHNNAKHYGVLVKESAE